MDLSARRARRLARRRESGKFPAWGVLALPGGLLWGALLGLFAGAFFGNAAVGVAVGAGVGLGAGLCTFAAAVVVASAKETPSPGTGHPEVARRGDK